jgi:hypothetical protein
LEKSGYNDGCSAGITLYSCYSARFAGQAGNIVYALPFSQIDTVLNLAKQIYAIVFLDIQVGFSTLQSEIPELEKYLKLPNVHLGIDRNFQ